MSLQTGRNKDRDGVVQVKGSEALRQGRGGGAGAGGPAHLDWVVYSEKPPETTAFSLARTHGNINIPTLPDASG